MISMFSTRLRELRLNKGLKQDQVAERIGVSKSCISTYENDTRQPSFEILVRLANFYRVSTDYLLGQTNYCTIDLSGFEKQQVEEIRSVVEIMVRIMKENNVYIQ